MKSETYSGLTCAQCNTVIDEQKFDDHVRLCRHTTSSTNVPSTTADPSDLPSVTLTENTQLSNEVAGSSQTLPVTTEEESLDQSLLVEDNSVRDSKHSNR